MSRFTQRCMRGVFAALMVLATLPVPSSARTTDTMPAPHLGYGVNVWDQVDLTAGLGFEWVKLFEEAGPPPATRVPYHVLYRVIVDGYPTSLPNYQQHIRDIVRAGRGKVDAYEIGNEPNLKGDGFWGRHSVDAEAYARLLCSLYPIIKSEDPNALVISAGLAPVGPWPPDQWWQVMDEQYFARRMFNMMKALTNGGFCMDGFGYHPHGFKFSPETDYHDAPNGFALRSSERMRDIMVEAGAGQMQMWATEFGWFRDPNLDPWTAGEEHTTYGWCNDQSKSDMGGFVWMEVSEQQQADYLVRAFKYADDNWPWMGPMFIWNLDMYHRSWSCSPQKFYSLFHATEGNKDLRMPTLAYAALRDMPKRSAWTAPSMTVTPDRLIFLGALDNPRALTQIVSILRVGLPFTWTASFDPPEPRGFALSPTSGQAPGTMAVSADVGLFAGTGTFVLTGTFAYTIHITADPTTTLGSPFTLPVTLRVMDHLEHSFLPLIQNKASASPTPTPSPTPGPSPTPTPPPTPITPTTRFGLSFVTSAEQPSDEARFQRAMDTGAGMDRWPLYWPNVERTEGVFEWSAVDRAVISDTAHGLQVDAILMLTPGFYATSGSQFAPMPRVGPQSRLDGLGTQGAWSISSAASPPVRLYEPVFSDLTDTPGITKTINSNNPWARFAYETVNRYKPGGMLAQQQGWPADRGVWHWEIWNEEDYSGFWIGTVGDYARLLKVAYLAARHADPQAKIIFGGLAVFEKPTWLRDTLAVINTYPDKDANNWFFDSVAEHNYAWSWQTYNYLLQASETLKTYTITNKSLWVTESGVALCDEYPGPACVIGGTPVPYRANPEEQAAFVIQSATYATWISYVMPVDVIFHFQLYDDCADLINPDLGGGFGLIRNPASGACFSKSPYPDTPRPSYAAFQSAIKYLRDAIPKWYARPGWVLGDPAHPGQQWISFYRPSTQERVLALWARGYVTETAVISATSASARLVWPDGSLQNLAPIDGVYTVTLPAATNINTPTGDGSAPIGGQPYFLVEPDPSATGGPKP